LRRQSFARPSLLLREDTQAFPPLRFHTLAHLGDEDTLRRAFDRLKGRAAVGVDGITKEAYGQNLEGPNKTRPIGISSVTVAQPPPKASTATPVMTSSGTTSIATSPGAS
jgi:hypothetical protein